MPQPTAVLACQAAAEPVPPAEPEPPVEPLLAVVGADEQLPLLGGGTATYANLDLAASAPCLQQVADAVADLLPRYASVHRSAGYASQVSTAAYEHGAPALARHEEALRRRLVEGLTGLPGVLPEAAARAVAAAHRDLDGLAAGRRHGDKVTLRWILVHMIEEYARHNGHADLLRERLDGRTGD